MLAVSVNASSKGSKPYIPEMYMTVAKEFNISPVILYSIALVESLHGKGVKYPWPWSVNDRGKAHWFETKAEAVSYCRKQIKNSNDRFDVGLMQINWHWHKGRFKDIDDAFTPKNNIRAGAAFLSELYERSGDMEKSVGDYHNRVNPYKAQMYKNRVRRKMRIVLSGRT